MATHDEAEARQKLVEEWSPLYKAWFPEALADPELALIEVTASQAEYRDSHQATRVHLFGLAKAALTGKAAKPGDNQKLHFERAH